jgi:CRP/FNR family cyclic AMP-dependent transcriptional regulator
MSIKDDVTLLKTVPMFARVDNSQLNVLAFSLERITVDPGDVLFRDGDRGDGAFVVADGRLNLNRRVGKGELSVTAERGTLVGEQSMFAEVPYRGTATAQSRTTVLKISRELFYKVAEEFPDLAVEAMRSVNTKLNHTLDDLQLVQRQL